MKQRKALQLYRTLMPAVERRRGDDPDRADSFMIDFGLAECFDGRALPFELVMDTGMAERHEASEIKKLIKLPYPNCYFEWQNQNGDLYIACCASEADMVEINLGRGEDEPIVEEFMPGAPLLPYHKKLGTIVEVRGWMIDEKLIQQAGGLEVMDLWPVHGRFLNGVPIKQGCSMFEDYTDDDPFFAFYNVDHLKEEYGIGPDGRQAPLEELRKAREMNIMTAQIMLLGTLALLEEKLLLNLHEPDPSPRLTAAREKRGRHRLTGPSNVLQVNVPAVRRMARATPSGDHEPPCLHWRRGHWRVLHRGSEFEDKTWVRKCLVGDPAKGFLSHKEYQLRGTPLPVIQLVPPSPPTILGV